MNIKLRNGVRYNPRKAEGLEIIDNNVVRDIGMNRIQSTNKTPFQDLLDTIIQSNYDLNEQQFSEIINKTLSVPSLDDDVEMFSTTDSDIIDCYNDKARRFFESLLAKKIMNLYLSDKSTKLPSFIEELKQFIIAQYTKENALYIKLWHRAKEGKAVKEKNLSHYSQLRKNLIVLIDDNHFEDESFLLNLFDLHYLTHNMATLKDYKTYHPSGYVKSYNENSPYYTSSNRGRIDGYGFNHNEPSYHLGIMRSIDKTPYDMRRPTLISSETRCPDRLYMIHPQKARSTTSNWLNPAFSNPHNSLYVNGLSGSILLEVNAVLFFLKAIQIKLYTCENIDDIQIAEENCKLLKDYLLMISSLFVYFEGGHTFTEIMSVFNLNKVTASINEVLHASESIFSLKSMMIDNPEIYSLIQESLIEAAQYQEHLEHQENVHTQLFLRKEKPIQTILDEFSSNIDNIGIEYPEAKKEAELLLAKLLEYKKIAFRDPSSKAMSDFSEKAHQAIERSLPIIAKDLPWKDFLLNMAKKIANILINISTFGMCKNHTFFAPKPSPSEELLKELDAQIQFEI